eukprot:scaffold24505_cov27-Tisochrysis_lutea.AAC.7
MRQKGTVAGGVESGVAVGVGVCCVWLQRIVEVWNGAFQGRPCPRRAQHRDHWGWRETWHRREHRSHGLGATAVESRERGHGHGRDSRKLWDKRKRGKHTGARAMKERGRAHEKHKGGGSRVITPILTHGAKEIEDGGSRPDGGATCDVNVTPGRGQA